MIKMVGAVMIIFSVMTLSAIPLCHHKHRMRVLRDFLHDFRFIHTEMKSNLSSVPDLMDHLRVKGGETTKSAYRSVYEKIATHGAALFQEDWCCIMMQYRIYLTSEEYGLLLNIGDILGKYILEEQLSALNNLIRLFEESFAKEKEIFPEKKKINLGIGTSLGIILVILLI